MKEKNLKEFKVMKKKEFAKLYNKNILTEIKFERMLLVEYTPPLPPVRGVYKPKKITKFFKLVYPPYPLKQQQLII